MLIRVSGYNNGAKEYLEEGVKEGREHSREELDERIILYGDLELTQKIYQSIPDNNQDRYLSYTLSFKEDQISQDSLHAITTEFKQFLLHAYQEHEINFYAEAHIPKIKQTKDRKTGELVDRKPHIHIIIPRKNMFNGNEANPAGRHEVTTKYMEAFQEYINQKYQLESPRDHIRFDPKDSASVLSRYKGDDFYGKNREFKQELVKQIIEKNILSRKDFYALVAEFGETRIRNQGKENEYLSVTLPGDAKGTNLKDTIFQDDFLLRRQLKKPPLDPRIIQERLREWPQRARELKYVSKATPSFRKLYKESSPEQQAVLLAQREHTFYQSNGEPHVGIHPAQRPRDRQRSAVETGGQRAQAPAGGLQDLSGRSVADDWQTDGQGERALLLSGDARLHLEPAKSGRDPRLRAPVSRGGRAGETRSYRTASVPAGAERRLIPVYARSQHRVAIVADIETHSAKLFRPHGDPAKGSIEGQTGKPRKPRRARSQADSTVPPYARSQHRVPSVADIEAHGARLFGAASQPYESPDSRAGPAPPATPRQPRSKVRRSKSVAPPYARHPHKVGSVADIEASSRRLFAVLNNSSKPAPVFKTQPVKPIAINRSASTVTASLSRALEQSQLLPAQRKAIRRADTQFYELRRFITTDTRLTKQDKAQLVSVLTFERLKAREAIKHPKLNNEVPFMGSASIRELFKDEESAPEFSISGPGRAKAQPIRERIRHLVDKLAKDVEPETTEERKRALQAADLYTKKARFSDHVHYIDKTSDKTVFIDTGEAIALRRTGINEAGVTIALQMAQQRFGTTLTIKGTAEFKHLVIEAAAKSDVEIHFTDKGMNDRLAERRAELALERDSDQIVSPQAPAAETPEQSATTATPDGRLGEDSPRSDVTKGVLVDHGSAPYMMDKKNDDSYYVAVKTSSGIRTLWGAGLAELMKDGGYQQGQPIQITDKGTEPVQKMVKNMETGVRESKEVMRRVWVIDPAPVRDKASPASATAAEPATVPLAASASNTPTTPSQEPAAVQSAAPTDSEKHQISIPSSTPNADVHRVQVVEPKAFIPTLVTAEGAAESFIIERELTFREAMGGMTEAEIQSSSTVMEWRAADHAQWLTASNDDSPAGLALLAAYLKDVFYRESFKEALEQIFQDPSLSKDALLALEPVALKAQQLVAVAQAQTEVSQADLSSSNATTVTPSAKSDSVEKATPEKPAKARSSGKSTSANLPDAASASTGAPVLEKSVAVREAVEPPVVVVTDIEEIEELDLDT